ncbi:hypothetical protein NA57DRAFT_58169 [Rhizodiscina lignyota]|uniref:Endoplasmic reticulum junction formation protein lunapark n=1 Tax=Rhizodiscina lignyota TaxID=1504668 RepID=A0A9P4I9R1_9PEZI|nr:hypothetical protein NA57DRAFT_58169 [Rhizodiscina lignyota]
MVSFWPWKGDTSFEKTLSALATKITKETARNNSLKQQARRIRVGWVLYAILIYSVVFVILFVGTGLQNWGPYEYTGVAGGPVLIYGGRLGLNAYFNWRLASSQSYLDGLYKERDKTIEKLKAETKYNSTQQLLDKYGTPREPKQDAGGDGKKGTPKGQKQGAGDQRIYRQPPPTANIPRKQAQTPSSPSGQQQPPSAQSDSPFPPPHAIPLPTSPTSPTSPQQLSPGAEFAPNAFGDASPQYAPISGLTQSRWYDRIMEALLGEDELQAKNRIALICQQCRLVNGQAPPGTKSLEEVGRWRCSSCGSWNGQESEASRLVKQLAVQNDARDDVGGAADDARVQDEAITSNEGLDDYATKLIANPSVGDAAAVAGVTKGVDKQSSEAFEEEPEEDADTPAKSTRSKKGGKKK